MDHINTSVSPKEALKGILEQQVKPADALSVMLASPMQKLYFLYQEMHPSSTAYNLPVLVKITGKLDLKRLERSIQEVIKVQESLRSNFYMEEGDLYQKVTQSRSFSLNSHFLSSDSELPKVDHFILPFSLGKEPLFRIKHFLVSKDLHYLFFDIHHIISDALSFQVLVQEIGSFYQLGVNKAGIKNYSEFARWQQAFLESEKGLKSKKFWSRSLAELPPKLELPIDFDRPKRPLDKGNRIKFHLSKQRYNRVKMIGSQLQITTYMFCFSVYAFLISKLTYQNEFIIGTAAEARENRTFKNTIGAFVNTLPIKIKVNPWQTVREYLEAVKELCLDAFENQCYPFVEMVENFADSSDPSRGPIFDTFFELNHKRLAKIELGELQCSIHDILSNYTKFDLTFEGYEDEDGIDYFLEYSTDLFKSVSIERIGKYFDYFTAQFVENLEVRLSEIHGLNPQETQFLEKINETDDFLQEGELFIPKFRDIAMKYPDKIALSSSSQQLTYQFLDAKTDQVAASIQALGVGQEERVACLMDRSDALLISLLSILKAGGVYIPVGPTQPIQRIKEIFEECQPTLILYDSKYQTLVDKVKHPCKMISVEKLIALSDSCAHFLAPKVFPETLAYVIFTSGSTGKPKGVMIQQRGMVNHLLAKVKDLEISPEDVVAQTSAQTFDVSIWQLLSPLLVGGRTAIIEGDAAWDPSLLFSVFNREKVTIFETVPSHLKIMMEYIEQNFERIPQNALRINILNGEALTPELSHKWYQYFPNVLILNAYGQTECSDDTCHYLLTKEKVDEIHFFCPLGTPIQNFKGYVLDSTYQHVPIQAMGQIFFSGIGIGRGYFNRPDLTAASFLPCPFLERGQRMYRTGDIGQFLSDGNLAFFGRDDSQVKIRGQRIELREVEHKILQHPLVKDIVATYKNELLTAYVIPAECTAQENFVDSLKRELRSCLIPAMIPDQIILLETFPLHPSGKVNFSALPKKTLQVKVGETPTTDTEKLIASTWSEIFSKEMIFKETDFFEEGGNSLLAMQFLARVRAKYKADVSLKMLFEYPTLEQFSKVLDQMARLDAEKQIEVLECLEKRYEPFPLTEVQQAYLLGRLGLYTLGDVSVHVYAEYEMEDLAVIRLEKAWNKVIDRHEALRTIFPTISTQQILKKVPYYKIEVIDFEELTEKEREIQFENIRSKHSHQVFELTSWPLFEIKVVKLKKGFRLILSFDVLTLDGWSIDILLKDWLAAYQLEDFQVEKLSLSFRDYVLTMQELRKSKRFKKDQKYWLDRAEDFPLGPPLPLISSPDNLDKQNFSRVSTLISEEIWKVIQLQLRTYRISPTGFLAGVFAYILNYYSGSDSFALNLTLFDRTPIHPQINQICGDFTSLTLLEVDFRKGEVAFLDKLRDIQNQLWEDLDHRLFTGIEMIREIGKRRKNQSSTLFPVVLTSVLGIRDEQNKLIEKFLGREIYSITQTPQVWLDFKAYEIGESLNIEWDFVKALFPQGFIEEMHASFVRLVKGFALDKKTWSQTSFNAVSKSLLQKRAEVNETNWPVTLPLLHEVFYKNVKKYAKKAAVISQERSLTYLELANCADQLASLLVEKGAQKNQLIAIFMEKGWEQVVTALGVLRSGAAYLPIDASLPIKRIAELLKQGEVKAIVSQSFLHKKIQELEKEMPAQISCIFVDEINFDDSKEINQISFPRAGQSDLAYVIFTSGSTGVPKGVSISHESVMNTVLDINDRYKMSNQDALLALSSLSFDLSVYDIFGPLAVGASIVIPSPSDIKNPTAWLKLIENHKVTFWNSVPLFMQMFIDYLAGTHQTCPFLRTILLSGDWISTTLPKRVKDLMISGQDLKLVSLGGATEASIWSIAYDINPEKLFSRSIPYGKPLRNQAIYILDKELRICPNWTMGEIYIGGKGLAKSYLNNKSATSTQFISHREYGRLYKTGDFGRYIEDGNIEFLGRKDFQVKFRGFRVELGEIESILADHKDVSNAKTIIHRTVEGHESLISYVTPLIESEKEEEGVILDPSERVEFKLKKNRVNPLMDYKSHGLLRTHLDTTYQKLSISRKSYRTFEGKTLVKEDIESYLEEIGKGFKTQLNSELKKSASQFQQLSLVFEHLSQMKLDGYLFPKYLYPSAGSTYSVKILCAIRKQIEDVYPGVYLYDPKNHSLIKKRALKEENQKDVTLCFVASLTEIEPLYGKYSKLFTRLEAGYMKQVVSDVCCNEQIPITVGQKMPSQCAEILQGEVKMEFLSSIDVFSTLPLTRISHQLQKNPHTLFSDAPKNFSWKGLQTFPSRNCLAPQKTECADFSGAGEKYGLSSPMIPAISLYVKKGKVQGMDEGWYSYCFEKEKLIFSSGKNPFDLDPSTNINYGIYADCSFALFFLSNQKEMKSREVAETGALSQLLSVKGVDRKIGCCPIGLVGPRGSSILKKTFPNRELIHALFVGPISNRQLNEKRESRVRKNIFEQKLKEHMERLLPSYMVPSQIIVLEKFPMTVNGKVDIKKLPKPALSSALRKVVSPQNETERQLAKIWGRVLDMNPEDISVEDSFFEIGGDSLSAVKMQQELSESIAENFGIEAIFNHPSIKKLAAFIQKKNKPALNLADMRQRASRQNMKTNREDPNIDA